MRKFGLIGFPLGHSFSKQYFAEKFFRESIHDCSYENFPIENISILPGVIHSEPSLEGLNVTIPYKSAVIPYLTSISPEAEEIGAVNVIKITRKASAFELAGFNSDVPGFTGSIKNYLRPEVKRSLVLGTGGSSRAVCYALKKLGIEVTLVSRAEGHGTISYKDVTRELLDSAHLIVNTTPLGMYPDVDSCPDIDYDLLDFRHILFDLVYNPERTLFLKNGEERGCTVVNGLEMLRLQAEKSWEIWNDPSL
jgi:shikimate dehydrogenase